MVDKDYPYVGFGKYHYNQLRLLNMTFLYMILCYALYMSSIYIVLYLFYSIGIPISLTNTANIIVFSHVLEHSIF